MKSLKLTINNNYAVVQIDHGKVNATLPKGKDPQSVTLEEALALIAEKAAKGPAKKPARGRKKG